MTTSCCMRLLKASDQRETVIEEAKLTSSHLTNQEWKKHWDRQFYKKNASKDIYICNSWFGSMASALAFDKNGISAILQAKTASSCYPKKFIESCMKDWPGRSHLVFETTVGYKYCKRKPFVSSSTTVHHQLNLEIHILPNTEMSSRMPEHTVFQDWNVVQHTLRTAM